MTDQGQINEENLTRLVGLFYGRVRADPDLGPIFNDAIADWPEHLAHLTDFWHSVMLTSGRFKGRPMMKHLMHRARIRPEHFDRWLALWAEATNEIMTPEAAAALQFKARQIGESFKLGLFYRPEDDDPALR
ncbi:MAG: group III truncated hemoglobin [Caulobacterales bacterium]|jgi:hemoglobin|nr:group III truncated hemoglobin [Caulobacterales bacterium]